MATKAERERSRIERSGPKRPPRVRRPPKSSAAASSTGSKNTPKRAAPRATSELEQTLREARPSRKSTRKARNRQKAGTMFEQRAQARMQAPMKRHGTRR